MSYEQPDFYFTEGSELPSIELVKVGKINGGSGDVSVTDLHFCPARYAATRCESSWTVTEERTAARSFFPNAKNKRKSPAGANGFI